VNWESVFWVSIDVNKHLENKQSMWILHRKVKMPEALGGKEEYIYFDGENAHCTYCTDINRAIKYKTFVDAHIGTKDLVELWTPAQVEAWYLQSSKPIGPVYPVYLMVYTVRERLVHTQTAEVENAKLFFSEAEALAYRDLNVQHGDWAAVQIISGD
jgi:hypothetical protein